MNTVHALATSLDFWWLMGCLFFPSACLWAAERFNREESADV